MLYLHWFEYKEVVVFEIAFLTGGVSVGSVRHSRAALLGFPMWYAKRFEGVCVLVVLAATVGRG